MTESLLSFQPQQQWES